MIKLVLAPMEGVVDFHIRQILTSIGGIDYCVGEFIRVTDQVYPSKVFLKNCPELKMGGMTYTGVPVHIQLLGGQPNPLAENAKFAVSLGAHGIDLNFGCPAPTVNRHDGGATLLKSPDRIFKIVDAVRKSVPINIPVSAKIRLGFESPELCVENAQAVEAAGASWLTVHCRTKLDGYRPPARWEWISKIKERSSIKIIANGDISNYEQLVKCSEVTQCNDFMIGRAAISNPFVFREIQENIIMSDLDLVQKKVELLKNFYIQCAEIEGPVFATARTKQWLKFMKIHSKNLVPVFERLKIIQDPMNFSEELQRILF